MNKEILKSIAIFVFFFCTAITVVAQNKVATIIMQNNNKMEGSVVLIKDDIVKFTYKGQAYEHVLKKSEINVIVFASGRILEISKDVNPEIASCSTIAKGRKGKIAITPVDFVANNSAVNFNLITERL